MNEDPGCHTRRPYGGVAVIVKKDYDVFGKELKFEDSRVVTCSFDAAAGKLIQVLRSI